MNNLNYPSPTVEERFWQYACPDPNTGCWHWMGATNKGYGVLNVGRVNGKNFKAQGAYVIAYELFHGSVPKGLELDHLCREPLCCNPDHVEPVSHAENIRRAPIKRNQNSGKSHCVNGHPLFGDNVYIAPSSNQRHCRACRLEGKRRRRREGKSD